jgi:hypothetical protein
MPGNFAAASANGHSMRMSSFRASPLAALLFLALALFAQDESYFPQHAEVNAHNDALAKGGIRMNSSPPEGVEIIEPDFDNPFAYSYVRTLDAMPSVDSHVSEYHRPSVLWAWGASYKNEYHKEYAPATGWDGCYREISTLKSNGTPKFSGTLEFEVQGRKFSIPANSPSVEVPQELWQNLSVLEGNNSSVLFPNLTFSINGSVNAPFLLSQTICHLQISTQPGGISEGCLCEQFADKKVNISSGPLFNSKQWQIETGNPLAIMLSPQGGEQLSYRPKFQALIFSSHRISQISLLLNGSLSNSSYLYKFGIKEGELGDESVVSYVTDEYGTNITETTLPLSEIPSAIRVLWGEKYALPKSFDILNRSFGYQYFFDSNVSFQPGNNQVSLMFRNHFGDASWQNFQFLVRDGAFVSISGNASGENATLVIINQSGMRAIPRGEVTTSQNKFLGNATYPGNEYERPAALPYSIPLPLPSESSLPWAILAFFGALWLFRKGKE